MNNSNSAEARQVAQTATAFERQQTDHVPKSVTGVLNEEMLVIALHAVLTRVVETSATSRGRRDPGAEVSPACIHEQSEDGAPGPPAHQRREARQVAGEAERTIGQPPRVCILRMLLAAALQCGKMSLVEGVACMHALDEDESHA